MLKVIISLTAVNSQPGFALHTGYFAVLLEAPETLKVMELFKQTGQSTDRGRSIRSASDISTATLESRTVTQPLLTEAAKPPCSSPVRKNKDPFLNMQELQDYLTNKPNLRKS